jgi:hypothetical protein
MNTVLDVLDRLLSDIEPVAALDEGAGDGTAGRLAVTDRPPAPVPDLTVALAVDFAGDFAVAFPVALAVGFAAPFAPAFETGFRVLPALDAEDRADGAPQVQLAIRAVFAAGDRSQRSRARRNRVSVAGVSLPGMHRNRRKRSISIGRRPVSMPHAARSHVSVCPVFGEVLAEGWRAVELGAGFGVPFARALDGAGGCHVGAALASAGANAAADAATTMSAKSQTHRRMRPRAWPAPHPMATCLVPAASTRF